MKREKPKERRNEWREFFRLAYCGLVLRGYDNEREIPDAILRRVWRFGKRVNSEERRAALRGKGKKS